MSVGPNPSQQGSWDARAACNFIAGGLGAGLVVAAALAGASPALLAAGLGFVAIGLAAVASELGRPWRSWRVLRNAARSWMSREALLVPLLFVAVGAAGLDVPGAAWVAALLALAFVYCQGRLLQAAKGIPAWREPLLVPLIVATALAEGAGALSMLAAAPASVAVLFVVSLLARQALWHAWRGRVRTAARAQAAIDAAGTVFALTSGLALALALLALAGTLGDAAARVLQFVAGAAAVAGGGWFKYTLVMRAGFNQGFALEHLPVRGVPRHREI